MPDIDGGSTEQSWSVGLDKQLASMTPAGQAKSLPSLQEAVVNMMGSPLLSSFSRQQWEPPWYAVEPAGQ